MHNAVARHAPRPHPARAPASIPPPRRSSPGYIPGMTPRGTEQSPGQLRSALPESCGPSPRLVKLTLPELNPGHKTPQVLENCSLRGSLRALTKPAGTALERFVRRERPVRGCTRGGRWGLSSRREPGQMGPGRSVAPGGAEGQELPLTRRRFRREAQGGPGGVR